MFARPTLGQAENYMNNTENFEPCDPTRELSLQSDDAASEMTSQVLRAMGWHEFDELLNSLDGVNKGKQIHILSTGFSP
jgi:hypothetical protein